MFAKGERLCAAGKALAARRVADSGVWRRNGDSSAAHWVARTSGTSIGRAACALETAWRLEDLPATDAAFRAGRLSEAQATEVSSAGAADPSRESELLQAAQREGVAGLRDRCRKVRAAALPDETARHEAVRSSRYLRHWTDLDGAFRLDGRLTVDAGARVLAALEPHRERAFADAREAGRREPYEAYLADALVALAEDRDPGRPKALVHVAVDHAAFVRGHTEAGETCQIPGVGPIPVATARSLSSDAVVAAVVTDGVEVTRVAHLGRTIPAHVRTALEARDKRCAVPECGARHRLEIDHIVPLAEGGTTRLDNLDWLCPWHHHCKTNLGFVLTGKPGEERRWVAPDDDGPSPPEATPEEAVAELAETMRRVKREMRERPPPG